MFNLPINLAIYVLLALQALDLISTVWALKNTHLVESNPLLAPLFKVFGPLPVLLVAKGALAAYLFYAQSGIDQTILWLMCAGYVYVVSNNFKLIRTTPKD